MAEYDVITIGGGPGGLTSSTLLSDKGYKVLLLEKSVFPRYQIGESLLPSTVIDLAKLLDLDDVFKEAGFVVKRGATFSWGGDPSKLWTMNFGRTSSRRKRTHPKAPVAYNVSRVVFDQLLLDNAISHNVEVRQGCRVLDFIEEDSVIVGVKYLDDNGDEHLVRARYVIDASGQRSLLAKKHGKREQSKFFQKIAIWRYFENADRLDEPLDGNVLFQTCGNAWIWYIPLSNKLTSVGVVLPTAEYNVGRQDINQLLDKKINDCPLIKQLLLQANTCTYSPYDVVRVSSEYSYCHTKFWVPGAIMIGDAACFVDVLLSSGVHLACYAGMLAARSIHSILNSELNEELCMNEFETRVRKEFAIFYDGLVGLYDMGLNQNAYIFWLRTLLQKTNGVYMEALEEGKETHSSASDSDLLRFSRQNINLMRAYNSNQINYDGPALMLLRDMPQLKAVLTRGSDPIVWVKV